MALRAVHGPREPIVDRPLTNASCDLTYRIGVDHSVDPALERSHRTGEETVRLDQSSSTISTGMITSSASSN
ncbi:hypothetical protein CEE69_02740 [Rhodopirellula bahusiensis]|uniref:Uncharacterized protein n=1 Tax=Rhodopirellula bahusiensis TaxID=2014065 RepID=A0A2G1WBE7_9BACT|nr:hypothetical protein CEE69_02740 [Rhodopirellula bahusiensis]